MNLLAFALTLVQNLLKNNRYLIVVVKEGEGSYILILLWLDQNKRSHVRFVLTPKERWRHFTAIHDWHAFFTI